MTGIDYATDILKHYVRKHGWLPACRAQRSEVRPKKASPLRYFTFCAADAIDVFMLEYAGVLRRSEDTGRLESVYFCEKDPEVFGEIAALIGSPAQGFQGEFEKIVLFEEDDDTKDRELFSEEDEPLSKELRKKLGLKDAHYRLKEAFPFDIINLDVFGNMFPPRRDDVVAPLLKSIIQLLRWQTEALSELDTRRHKQFALFLTSPVDARNTNEQAIKQLINLMSKNIETYSDFRTSFASRFRHEEANKLAEERFAEFFCLSLSKFIAQRTLFDLGWEVEFGPTYLYRRQDAREPEKRYQIMHCVAVCKRIPDLKVRLDDPRSQMYKSITTQLLNDGAREIDGVEEEEEIVVELKEDLNAIVEYRDKMRS